MPGHTQSVAGGQYDHEQNVCMPEEDQSQDFGSNSAMNAEVTGGSAGGDAGQIHEASKDLGEVNGLNSGFTDTAGGLLDRLIPNEGDKGKLEILINVPLDQTGTVNVSFLFACEVERDDKGVIGRVRIGGGVTCVQEVRAYFFAFDVFARAMVFGYMEANGANGAAMFKHLLLGIQRRVASVSKRIADAVFDAKFIEDVVEDMRAGDYVTSGLGATVEAGANLTIGHGEDAQEEGAGAGVTALTGTTLTADGQGNLASQGVSQLSGKLTGSADPFALEGSLTGKWTEGTLSGVEGELSGAANLSGGELNELVVGGRWLSGVISQLGSILSGGSGLLQKDDAARKAGALGSFVANVTFGGALVEKASADAISKLNGMGVEVGHRLNLKAGWDAKEGMSLEISLERTNTIEYGDSLTDRVHVLLENVQRVFKIKFGGK
jgi:hypothetical protein